MPTTSNFGWTTPADTDLVKDGAAAIRTLGNGIDNSFLDLKGGTSGQILSKNSNTDLDFVWIANDQGDITAVTAGTGISGGGTSGAVTITNSMATEITAKGDLIVGTGNAAFDNLPAGTNGHVLTADSTVSPTGLKWAALPSASPASASATVATNDAIASATYGDLTSAGPAVTLTTGTKALVIVTAYLENDGAGQAFMGYAVSGATTIAATDTTALVKYGSGNYRMSAVSRLSSLTAGSNTFTAKYRRTGSGTYGYFTDREICVIDLGS